MQEAISVFSLVRNKWSLHPVSACYIQEHKSAYNIGLDKCLGPGNGIVHVRFGSKMNYTGKIMLIKEPVHHDLIANISLHKFIPGMSSHSSEIFFCACIRKQIQIDNRKVFMVLQKIGNKIRTYESCASSH